MWLLVGIRKDEVPDSFPYEYMTLDIENADIVGEIFSVETWEYILNKYGEKYFDVIMTDGGLMFVKRENKIIQIKHDLLKDKGVIFNYTSIIGTRVLDPLERGYRYQFFKIRKKDYTILNHDIACNSYEPTHWTSVLRKKIKLVI